MREITYKEILENIDCGLIVFFEDDFIQPAAIEINDILYKAIRMDEDLQRKMISILDVADNTFSSALKAFLEVCNPAVDDVDDWAEIADVEDVLSQYKMKHPELAGTVDAAFSAITSVSCEKSLPTLFQFGIHCNVPSKYNEVFSEYIEEESRWQPFVVFDNYNTDIATQVESLIENMPDPNNTVTCIIDNSIRGENRANEIIDELERICKNVTKRVIGAVVTSKGPIERIGETLFIEHVDKDNISKLKQALLRSAYHYLLRMLKDRLNYQVNDAFKKATYHKNIAIYLATMARIEGISNYEVLMQWISAICEVGLSSSCDIPKLVAIANMLDACEEAPDFEDMEDMSDINTHEAFDYEINRFYQPVAPGDIFQTSDGSIYILVGQSCDMMMGDVRKRRNGLCELVKAEATALLWNNKTLDNFNHVWINNFKVGEAATALKIDYKSRSFLDNELISLCSFNTNGECTINLSKSLSPQCARMLQPYQINYYSNLQEYFGAVRKICTSTERQYLDIVAADDHVSRIVKLSNYSECGDSITYSIKRIGRLKSHYYLYLYKLFLEYRGRLPFETINLARMQTINAKFYDSTHEILMDTDVFLARNAKSSKTLPWILKQSQITLILESSSANTTIKTPDEHYLLDDKPLSVKLSNGKSLVLEKKAPNRVYYQIK